MGRPSPLGPSLPSRAVRRPPSVDVLGRSPALPSVPFPVVSPSGGRPRSSGPALPPTAGTSSLPFSASGCPSPLGLSAVPRQSTSSMSPAPSRRPPGRPPSSAVVAAVGSSASSDVDVPFRRRPALRPSLPSRAVRRPPSVDVLGRSPAPSGVPSPVVSPSGGRPRSSCPGRDVLPPVLGLQPSLPSRVVRRPPSPVSRRPRCPPRRHVAPPRRAPSSAVVAAIGSCASSEVDVPFRRRPPLSSPVPGFVDGPPSVPRPSSSPADRPHLGSFDVCGPSSSPPHPSSVFDRVVLVLGPRPRRPPWSRVVLPLSRADVRGRPTPGRPRPRSSMSPAVHAPGGPRPTSLLPRASRRARVSHHAPPSKLPPTRPRVRPSSSSDDSAGTPSSATRGAVGNEARRGPR